MGRQIVWKILRRRLQPGEHGSAHAQARRGGQGVRRPSASSGRSQSSCASGTSTSRRCRRSSWPLARRTGERSTRSTRGRSAGSPTTSPRAGSTGSTSRRTNAGRRSRSSTRTTTTARTTCTGSAPRSARPTRTPTSSPRRRTRRAPRPFSHRWRGSEPRGAEVFVILAAPAVERSRRIAYGKALGFNPDQIYINSVGATAAFMDIAVQRAGADYVNGSITSTTSRTRQNPGWANDAAMKQYSASWGSTLPSANAYDASSTSTGSPRRTRSSRRCTRPGRTRRAPVSMNALLSMNSTNRFALPGVRQKTRKTDHFIISQMQLQRFNNGQSGRPSARSSRAAPRDRKPPLRVTGRGRDLPGPYSFSARSRYCSQ